MKLFVWTSYYYIIYMSVTCYSSYGFERFTLKDLNYCNIAIKKMEINLFCLTHAIIGIWGKIPKIRRTYF